MSAKSPRFPRMDLPRFGMSELGMSVSLPWSESIDLAFGSLVSEQVFRSGTLYTLKGTSHIIVVVAGRQIADEVDDESQLHVQIRFFVVPDDVSVQVPRSDRREAEFVSALAGVSERSTIECTIELVLDQVDVDALWFPLPTLVGERSDGYEIRGVRAAKVSGGSDGDGDFSFTMDRPTGEAVFIDLRFLLDERITVETPRRVIDRGFMIAQQLVGSIPGRRNVR